MNLTSKLILTGVLFLISVITGHWLHSQGRPLKTGIFTVHKLVALTVAIYAAILFYKSVTKDGAGNLIWFMLAVLAVSVIVIFVTGGIMSRGVDTNRVMIFVHNGFTIVAAIFLFGAVYIMLR